MFSHSHSLQRNSPFAHSLCIAHGAFIGVEFADRINELNFMVHNVKHIQPSWAENVKLCAGLLILSQFGCSCCRRRRPFILLQNCKSKLHLLVKRQNIDCVYTNLIRFHQSFRVCYLFRWFAVWILSKFSFHFEMVCAVCSSRFSNRTWFFGGFVLKMPTFTRIYIYLQLCSVQHMLLSFWSGGNGFRLFIYIMHYEFYSFRLHFRYMPEWRHAVDQMKFKPKWHWAICMFIANL